MKWIEYQVLCNKDKNIFIDKKIEHTEANLTIAKSEAYNGQYYITEDEKTFEKKPVEIEFGGTNAKTAEAALINLGAVSKTEFNQLGNTVSEIDKEQKATTRLVEYLHKMEHGIKYAFEESSDIAYSKKVSTGAKMVSFKEIGGMSYRCENLLKLSAKTQSTNGVTITVNADGSITLNGTVKYDSFPDIGSVELEAGTYTLSGGFKGGSWSTIMLYCVNHADWASNGGGSTYDFSGGVCNIGLALYTGYTFNNLTIYPMINKGSIKKPWQPYFDGLRDSKVTAVESVGSNIFGGIVLANKIKEVAPSSVLNEQNKTIEYNSYEVSQKKLFLGFKPNTQYTFILKGKSAEQLLNLGVAYTDGTFVSIPSFTTANEVETIRFVSNGSKSIASFDGEWRNGTTTLYYEECGIFEGSVLTEDFSSYFKNTFAIPEVVQNLDGFGQGVNAQRYNKIVRDPASGVLKYVKMVEKIEWKGTEEMSAQNYAAHFTVQQFNISGPSGIQNGINVLCNEALAGWNAFGGNVNEVGVSSGYIVIGMPKSLLMPYGYVDGTSSTYVSSLKAYLKAKYDSGNPAVIVYALANPIEIDLKEYLSEEDYELLEEAFTFKNIVGSVEGNGDITFVNEHQQAVPNKEEFLIDLAEVVS